jgi:hypothetical protein
VVSFPEDRRPLLDRFSPSLLVEEALEISFRSEFVRGVEIEFFDGWYDGPLSGVARYDGRDGSILVRVHLRTLAQPVVVPLDWGRPTLRE